MGLLFLRKMAGEKLLAAGLPVGRTRRGFVVVFAAGSAGLVLGFAGRESFFAGAALGTTPVGRKIVEFLGLYGFVVDVPAYAFVLHKSKDFYIGEWNRLRFPLCRKAPQKYCFSAVGDRLCYTIFLYGYRKKR